LTSIEELLGYNILDLDEKCFINSGKRDGPKDAKERLVINFDPEVV